MCVLRNYALIKDFQAAECVVFYESVWYRYDGFVIIMEIKQKKNLLIIFNFTQFTFTLLTIQYFV